MQLPSITNDTHSSCLASHLQSESGKFIWQVTQDTSCIACEVLACSCLLSLNLTVKKLLFNLSSTLSPSYHSSSYIHQD